MFLGSLYERGLYYLNMNKTTSSLSEGICLDAALVQFLHAGVSAAWKARSWEG